MPENGLEPSSEPFLGQLERSNFGVLHMIRVSVRSRLRIYQIYIIMIVEGDFKKYRKWNFGLAGNAVFPE